MRKVNETMRYLNWDVLLFPAGSKVPMQEFKTGCYAVQDPELLGTDPVAGLPGMPCFLMSRCLS